MERAGAEATEWPRLVDRAVPLPARAAPDRSGAPARRWSEPADDGSCPVAFPIKAKLGSGIYHPPGGANYERTKADRCYADPAVAQADGLRPSKV